MTEDKKQFAFPSTGGTPEDSWGFLNEGMELRDYFAAKAMQGVIAHQPQQCSLAAGSAYEYADAMLEARKKDV